MASWFCFCSSSSSTSHMRSFCLGFLFLATLLTLINIFTATTTTTTNRATTVDYGDLNRTTSSSPFVPLLYLSSHDVHHRFNCYGRAIRHASRTHKNKNKNRTNTSIIRLVQPKRITFDENLIPYDYNAWESAPLMPRLVTECEHNIMMQLLKRFDQLTRKYSLEYMIIDGTLLGSWRHHDLIPWDDDIDLLMSVRLKQRLNMAIQLESPSSPYHIEFHHRWDAPKEFEYYKFYFSTSPRFSEYPWRYPFVDLIFYHENQTHLWQENMQHISVVAKQSIFPLQFRPLGPLWLPAPKSPRDYFASINWTSVERECFSGHWSHKYERTKDIDYGLEFKSMVDCQELSEFYPFVERSSTGNEERLVVNRTVRHIVNMIVDNEYYS